MREIEVRTIQEKIKSAFLYIGCHVDKEACDWLQEAVQTEENENARFALQMLLQNNEIAARENVPACQDTGMALVFLTVGQDVHFVGGSLADAIQQGVREAYQEGCFRKSVLTPLERKNTLDNTPAIVHTEIVDGDRVEVAVCAKGFGSENMSRVVMLTPASGKQGVENAIVETARLAGSNPCPPMILGVGIGGTMEKAALLSKQALLRDGANPDKELANWETVLLEKINALQIGAQGFGGNHTALAVKIATFPTHLAGLPVAITVQCHASRHMRFTI